MKYPLASSTWDDSEKHAIEDVIQSGRFTMGSRVKQFEQQFAEYFGARYAVMVNSGSSANLLAVAALRYRSEKPLCPGDEVIVPAVSWSTTYAPLHQYGLKLHFVDIDLDSLNLDLNAVQEAISDRTRAIFAPNILGAPNDLYRLRELCDKHDLILIEDNCESMGAKLDGRYTGTFGVCGTFSTFFSHHICTMEGGMVVTDDQEIYHLVTSLRAHGWTRDLPSDNHICTKNGDDFTEAFRFVVPGYNVRPLEISAAIGQHQLSKLDGFLEVRRRNARRFIDLFDNLDYVKVQKPIGESSWFGFSMILDGPLVGRRDCVIKNLMSTGVECRPIVAGNFTKNPVIRFFDYKTHGDLPNASRVDTDGFFIGNHHFDIADELSAVKEVMVGCAVS